ncbi:MAG: DUF4158 domain-containing protein, partial [Spirochaetia bacterium]
MGVALQIGVLRLTGAPLNSVEMIPAQVLAHLGAELGIAAPHLASVRALYRRRRTLFEHQDAAKQALGLHDLTGHGERALNGFLELSKGLSFDPRYTLLTPHTGEWKRLGPDMPELRGIKDLAPAFEKIRGLSVI